MLVIAFLWFKLGEVDKMQKEQVLIEFHEEIKPLEDKNSERTLPEEGPGEAMPVLDRQTLHSIASNVASRLDKEISTQKYEQQVMQELGISTLRSGASATDQQSQAPDENAVAPEQQETTASDKDFEVPNIIRKDNTTVSYFLEGRWHSYIYIPTYKCLGGGTVILDIVINQSGKVVSALIAENKSTNDDCLRKEAYQSAVSARFNTDAKASPKQLGTITYVFLPQ
jgi:hypothetical protein